MRSILRWCTLCASIAMASLVALPAGAAYADEDSGHTIVVHAGQSIQAAVDAAVAGDTIVVDKGTYKESVTITTDHITLKSKRGAGPVILDGAGVPTSANGCAAAFCVLGHINPDFSPGLPRVTGTRIDGFIMQNYSGDGTFLFNASDSAVTNSEAKDNTGYGIAGFVQYGIRLLHNVSHNNVEPGFYIGDSPNANAYVVGNRSFHNGVGLPEAQLEGFGFLFRDSSHGVVRDNSAFDNCAGFVFVDSRLNANTEPLNDWRVAENSANHNHGTCLGEDSAVPPTAGIGFALVGTQHVTLQKNSARGNGTTRAEKDKNRSGGILVISAKDGVGGPNGSDPTDNLIVENKAFGNIPFDIYYDTSGTGNKFEDNRCRTSLPPGLCQSGRDD
jgi:parallel beta helix pectate lyase-like protein